jgi:hypothetical protein
MSYNDVLGFVPPQHTGKAIHAEAHIDFDSIDKAKAFYETAKARLLDVNHWHEYAGLVSAVFQLFDEQGKETEEKVLKRNFIRVDIPGPGSAAGGGYDWVIVEEFKTMEDGYVDATGFRVRPCANPNGDSNIIAHFYDDSATSSFWVSRSVTRVSADIVDHNTKPNDDTSSLVDKIRDTPVAIAAIGMFSKAQWQNLVNGLVKQG